MLPFCAYACVEAVHFQFSVKLALLCWRLCLRRSEKTGFLKAVIMVTANDNKPLFTLSSIYSTSACGAEH